jgi:hypothetical protein
MSKDKRLPRNLLDGIPPEKRKALLEKLNRAFKDAGAVSSTHVGDNPPPHVVTPESFKNERAGALSRDGASRGAAESLAPRMDAICERNKRLAQIFLQREKQAKAAGSDISRTQLMINIGAEVEKLGRSAAIEAINHGLQLLSK